MTLPTQSREAHARSFPLGAFYPSSIRPLNREVMDALFLNEVFEVDEPELDPAAIQDSLQSEVLMGDKAAKRKGFEIFEAVGFARSEATSKNVSTLIRITHPSLAKVYVPPDTFGTRAWVRFFLASDQVDPALRSRIRQLADTAATRKENVFERGMSVGIRSALSALKAAKATPNSPKGSPPSAGLPVISKYHCEFARLAKLLVEGYEVQSAKDATLAEQALDDVRRLYEVFLWLYWVQMHASAHYAIQDLRSGAPVSGRPGFWYFGYETERGSISERPFASSREDLERTLYSGSIALNALVALHQSADLTSPVWFTELSSTTSQDSERAQRLDEWVESYAKLVGDVTPTPGPSLNLGKAIVRAYEAIQSHYAQVEKETDRFPKTVGYGVARHLGAGDSCVLFMELGRGARRGVTAMVDQEMLLLIGRALAGGKERVRIQPIFEFLKDMGIGLDDFTIESIISDFERRGLLRSLSDSGEAMYVNLR